LQFSYIKISISIIDQPPFIAPYGHLAPLSELVFPSFHILPDPVVYSQASQPGGEG